LYDGKTLSRYQAVEAGWRSIVLSPAQGQEEALFRIFQRTVTADGPTTLVRKIAVKTESVLEPLFQIPAAKVGHYVEFEDAYRLGGQEDGTWTLSANVTRRRNFQEDMDYIDEPEDFAEISAIHRSFHKGWRSYFFSQLLGRIRKYGGPTLGLKAQMDSDLQSLPFNLRLMGQFYLQRPESYDSGNIEGFGELRGALLQIRELGLRTYHTPSLSIFGRLLSMDTIGEYEPDTVDQDIFTPYKADHKTGIRFADTLTYRPWLDTIWYAGGSITSNENFIQPDHFSLRTGWKQLMGVLQLNAGYRYTYYFADNDRADPINRHFLRLELLYDIWLANQYRLEAGLMVEHELESSKNSGLFFCSWHLGNGRGYQDFRPGEIDFLGIRQRRVTQKNNNTVRLLDDIH
jgi:hypothetical protein